MWLLPLQTMSEVFIGNIMIAAQFEHAFRRGECIIRIMVIRLRTAAGSKCKHDQHSLPWFVKVDSNIISIVRKASIVSIAVIIAGHLHTGSDDADDARCLAPEPEGETMLTILIVCVTFHPKAWSDDADDARGFGVSHFCSSVRPRLSGPSKSTLWLCRHCCFSGPSVGRNSKNLHDTAMIRILAGRVASIQAASR